MSETKWTPGPWLIEDEMQPVGEFQIIAPSDDGHAEPWCIAQTFGGVGHGEDESESLANARLIAAAPNMAEALELFVRQWNACGPNSEFGRYFQNVRDAAVAALAKIQGRQP